MSMFHWMLPSKPIEHGWRRFSPRANPLPPLILHSLIGWKISCMDDMRCMGKMHKVYLVRIYPTKDKSYWLAYYRNGEHDMAWVPHSPRGGEGGGNYCLMGCMAWYEAWDEESWIILDKSVLDISYLLFLN